jgi:hypothetical protein
MRPPVVAFVLALLATPAPAAARAERAAAELGPGGTYVVKRGDTLAGIAQRYYGDAGRWREIWERNRFIANPNRIFPGDTLVIPGYEPPPPPPPIPLAPAEVIACSSMVVDLRGPLGFGSVIYGTDQKLELSSGDTVELAMDPGGQAAVGDRYALQRSEGPLRHPFTGQIVGIHVRQLGVVEVTQVLGPAVRGRVLLSCAAGAPGDRVARYVPVNFPFGKEAVPTSQRTGGTIVGDQEQLQRLGLGNLVFLDVGMDQGVALGDVFAIYQEAEMAPVPPTGARAPVAPTRLGEVTVIRTTPRAATGMISQNEKEIRVGLRVVLSRKIP